MKKLLVLLMMLFSFNKIFAQVKVYKPAINISAQNVNIFPSKQYKISLFQHGVEYSSFVYCMNAMHTTNNSKTTAWTNFSFENVLTIRIEVLEKENINYVNVLPSSKSIEVRRIGNRSIEFEISEPGQYSVEFEKGILIEHPLLLFANPIEIEIPAKENENVIYFENGYHEIGDRFKIPSGKIVYLEGGAYVKGQFYAENGEDVVIRGRGILSGEDYEPRTHQHMIDFNNVNNVYVEGITIIHSPRYMIALRGKNHHINNVKMLGWWFSTDGISAGENCLIENCFFKVNDDAVKLYKSNTEVRNCVIWQMENGAPFMISWNGAIDFGNCKVHDIDIIRVEHHWDNENLAVVCAVHGGPANISDFEFENITIENSNWRIFHLITKPNRWARWDQERGSLSNLTFKNFNFIEKQNIKSLILGHDKFHPVYNIIFQDIFINGQRMINLEDFIIIDKEFTHNIQLK